MYVLTPEGFIIRKSDLASIPEDDDNTDYINYKAWVAAGNTAVTLTQAQLTALYAIE